MSKPKAQDVFCVELVDQALIYVIARSAKGGFERCRAQRFCPGSQQESPFG